jgi:hypothetical protein
MITGCGVQNQILKSEFQNLKWKRGKWDVAGSD